MQAAWGPWVSELVDMLDGLGTMRHLPEAGPMGDQPARDMEVFRVIRAKWVDRMNARRGAT